MKKGKTRKLTRRILSFVLTTALVVGLMPGNILTVLAEGTDTVISDELIVESVSSNDASATTECTCGTDDPAFHATNCSAYIAPENPQCFCAEKCTEDTLNVWCDVCGVQGVSACQGEDIAVTYAAPEPYDGVPVTPQKITSSNYRTFGLTESNWGQYNGYYAIRNAKEFYGFAEIINDYNLSNYTKAVLLNDIVVNETVSESGATYSWTPIGGDVYFSGEFDGNGHSISGLYCNTPDESNVGLFGHAGVAIIRNVTLENSYLCGNTRVGGIVGRLSSATLTNCKVDSDVTIVATSSDEAVNVGGMFGKADIVSIQHAMCNFTNCTSLATVKALNVHKRESGYYAASMGAFCGYADYELCEQTAGTNCFYVPNSVTGADGTSDRGAGGDNVINERLATITIDNNGEITDTHTCVSATHSRIEPTCYSTGLTEYSYCIICGEVTSGTKEEIPTVEHYCPDGFCVYCGISAEELSHTYSDATCIAPQTCIICGHQKGEVDPNNHTTQEIQYELSESDKRYHDLVYDCCGTRLSELHKDSIENGKCTKCGWECEHLSITNGKCDDCGALGDIVYVDRYWDNVNNKVVTNNYALASNVTEITSLTTTLSEGWYIVKGEITNDNRLTVSGEVNLILTDGCTLNVSSGINVPGGATLNIYGQLKGTGKIKARGYTNDALIGGNSYGSTGTITINGGTIQATVLNYNEYYGAAIGSGKNASGTYSITINGGRISATNYGHGAAIGSGDGESGTGTVTINGGDISASSLCKGAAIGAGSTCSRGSVNIVIRGGIISVSHSDYYGNTVDGIGWGSFRNGQVSVTIDGGNVKATTASYSGVAVKEPKNSNGAALSLVEITLNGAGNNTIVTEVEGITYGLHDVKTYNNKLYFYLPADTMPTSVTVGGNTYTCNLNGTFYQEHCWVEANCLLAKHCSNCGISEGEKYSNHNYVDGVCTVCGMDENGVFHITTAEHLVAFEQYVNAGNKDVDAELDADIDMTGVAWTPICQTVSFHDTAATDTGYSGTFDGNGHTISNLIVTGKSGATYSYGLFGTVSGTVKNLGMVNYTYTMGSAPDARAGSIAGQVISGGTITNCYSVGHTVTTNSNIAGGIAGCNYGGTISNCYALNGSVSGYSTRWGGVVGDCKKDSTAPDLAQTYGTVSNCYTDDERVASTQKNSANITNCAVKDDTAFASGEVTYLLNGSSSENVTWYQKLLTDTYPVLDSKHGIVYSVFKCDGTTPAGYSNENKNESHIDENGDEYCDDCGVIYNGIGAHLAGYSVSLNGSIGVNFHMDLTQDVLDDNEAYMLFTLPNGTSQKVMVSDAKAKESAVIEGKTYYIFTCNVAAKEMTDTIQAQLITSDGSKTQVYEYSVREYADRILSGSYDAETQELVKAMLHYGAYSQEWFNYNTTNLANAGLDTLDLSEADDWDEFNPIISNNDKVGSFTSAYLTLESDTAINLKFKLADGVSFEDLRVVVEDPLGNVVPVTTDTTENVCLITLTGIKASDLDTTYCFCVTDGEGNESAILYSAMSYACAVANSEMDQKLKNVTAALRIFNLRANEKFEY